MTIEKSTLDEITDFKIERNRDGDAVITIEINHEKTQQYDVSEEDLCSLHQTFTKYNQSSNNSS